MHATTSFSCVVLLHCYPLAFQRALPRLSLPYASSSSPRYLQAVRAALVGAGPERESALPAAVPATNGVGPGCSSREHPSRAAPHHDRGHQGALGPSEPALQLRGEFLACLTI